MKDNKECMSRDEIKRKREVENFIIKYTEALENNSAAVFAGAGLSIPSGELSWKELLRKNAKSIGLDVDKENDLILVAQYIYNEFRTRNTISNLIKNYIDRNGKINENHEILSRLPIRNYWTTNYDTYIERSLILANKKIDVKRNVADLAVDIENVDNIIYKMHGDITMADSTVLIKDDYEIYDKKNELFISKLRGDLLDKTFIFIGFSFEDPNLEAILAKLRILLEENPRIHYCFLKKVSIKDFENENLKEKEKLEKYEYQLNKQELKINDLLRYGIKVILVNEYSEITEILKKLERKILSKKVFISGAIEYYNSGSYFNEYKKVDAFCQTLSKKLYLKGYKIYTGMGLGIGRSIISGVLSKVYEKERVKLTDELIIKPFPQNKELYSKYRKDILKECGNIIFLFGNKLENGEMKLSDGMDDEYEIAKELKLKIIPVGATGFKAEEILKKEKNQELDWLNEIEVNDKMIDKIINYIKKDN